MEKLVHLLQKYATGKVVLVLFTLTMTVYLAMLLYSIPAVVSYAPDMKLFDLSPTGYSFEYAIELLEGLGAEGRTMYLTTQLPLDFIYPGLFSVTCSLFLTWLFRKKVDINSKVYYFSLVPIAAGIFDYVENIFIISMINSFPELSKNIVEVASIITFLKSAFTIIFFVLVFWGLIRLANRKQSTA